MSGVSPALREQVKQRAGRRCEYCRLPEGLSRFEHQVDHVRPPRHGGTDELINLACACFRCNNFKGTDIATVDFETDEGVWLFNPRQQQWDDHFLIDANGYIVGKSAIGRATARLLQMNNQQLAEIRLSLIEGGIW